MILGDSVLAANQTSHNQAAHGHGITIDELFRRAAARRPHAIALADAPNRETFTDGQPMRLSYAEADRLVSAIAGRLRCMGLPTDAIVGIQLPNTVENILTILGVLRAGLIAAPLPLLWRRAGAVAALARIGAKAFITCSRVDNFEHCQFATRVAAEVFSIRYVCGYGSNLPDGVVPLNDLFTAAKLDPIPKLDRDNNAAAHLAIISFDVGEDGPVPVARRHIELMAGGLNILLESRIEQDAAILSTIAPASFAGICLTLMPWLVAGGTLVLHHPFAADDFARQRRDERCGTLVLPAPVAFRLAETGLFAHEGPTTVVAAWRTPERLGASADWSERGAVLVDVSLFGEAGLVAARRSTGGRAVPLPFGPVLAPHDADGAVTVAELSASATNTLAVRGPMVPCYVYPPRIEHSDQPYFEISRDGSVDTGFPCRVDHISRTTVLTGPPTGVVNVGGYRFPLCALLETIGRIAPRASLAAMPDDLFGHRLVGTAAADPDAVQAVLDAAGLNPLVAMAFAADSEPTVRAIAAG